MTRLAEAAPRTITTRFLDLPGGRIAYDDAGSGPLVVAVPSMGDVRAEYRFLAPRLVAAGFRVVTVDIRGHGESSTGWDAYTPEAVGRDILALIRHLDAGPATILGESFAAGAAVWAAVEAPDLVRSIILIGPFARVIPQSPIKRLFQRAMIAALLGGPWAARAWSMYYSSLYPTAKPADLDEYRQRLVAMLREPGRMAALKGLMAATQSASEVRLDRVAVPALVIMGAKDPDFDDPAAEARIIAGRVGGQVVMIDGAGHYPQAEMPEAAANAVLPFLTA